MWAWYAYEVFPVSNSSAHDSRRTRTSDVTEASARSARLLRKPVEAVGFWAAIALPFLYLPLLIGGPAGAAEQTTCYGLMALHAVALLVGHAHRRGDDA